MQLLDPKDREVKIRSAIRDGDSKFQWVEFTTVAATSELTGTSIEELALNQYEYSERAWECGRYVDFP